MNLPDSHADFIFSVAGEEMGMIFAVFLVGLYGYIILRGYNRIMDTDNMFVILASGGILTLFGLQALINMGSAIHLLPTKGMTLPFISYGGSSLLSTGIGMGMLLALTRRQARTGIARAGLSIRPIGGDAK
jgi:cell division protein FtsW